MSIRNKIASIAFVFLVIFGTVVCISTILQRQLSGEIESTFEYNVPIRTSISDFDVLSGDYELLVLRLVRRSNVPQTEVESISAHARKDAEQMTNDLRQTQALLEQGMADQRLPEESRLVFSGMMASLPFIERHFDPFIQTGERVLKALVDGRADDARTLSLGFQETEDAFGADTAAIRQKLADLQETLGSHITTGVQTIEYLSLGLFALAACLGITAGAVVAANIVRTLRCLIQGTKDVQQGKLAVTIPITTKDELGELAIAFNHMVEEIRAKERIQSAFGKFVDPRIVAGFVSGTREIEHDERQVATIFFSDIAGFTSISEQLTPSAIVNLLNHYYSAVTGSILENNGIVDKFIGDGVMAFWSAPFSPADCHAASACLSALAQQEAIEKLNRDLPNILGLRRNAPTLSVRMGIATGDALVGTIGSEVSKSFTVIGDIVNLASRLEGVNKIFGARIIVAESTLLAAKNSVESRELDMITVVGKTEPVRIYEVLCRAGQLKAEETELVQEFGKGLAAYRTRDWNAADRRFQRCLTINPNDAPSTLYVERIAKLRKEPLPSDWDGVWRLA